MISASPLVAWRSHGCLSVQLWSSSGSRAWINTLMMANMVVGRVWLYTLWAGGIKITYLWRGKPTSGRISKKNTGSLIYQTKIQYFLITNRHGLILLRNGWCYRLCQICIQQVCAGNRISIWEKIMQFCAHCLSVKYHITHVPILVQAYSFVSLMSSSWISDV